MGLSSMLPQISPLWPFQSSFRLPLFILFCFFCFRLMPTKVTTICPLINYWLMIDYTIIGETNIGRGVLEKFFPGRPEGAGQLLPIGPATKCHMTQCQRTNAPWQNVKGQNAIFRTSWDKMSTAKLPTFKNTFKIKATRQWSNWRPSCYWRMLYRLSYQEAKLHLLLMYLKPNHSSKGKFLRVSIILSAWVWVIYPWVLKNLIIKIQQRKIIGNNSVYCIININNS